MPPRTVRPSAGQIQTEPARRANKMRRAVRLCREFAADPLFRVDEIDRLVAVLTRGEER